MSLIKFLSSKAFLKQIALAAVAILVIVFILLKWLNITTNHGEFETVPDLTGKSINVAEIELEQNNLVMQIQDSANFNLDYPRFSVIEQDPPVGSKVNEDRKIDICLFISSYTNVQEPDVAELTRRQAGPTLRASVFQLGELTLVDNSAKSIVLQMLHEGKEQQADS